MSNFQPLEARLAPAREGASHSFRLKVAAQNSAPGAASPKAPAAGEAAQPPPAGLHEPAITIERDGEHIKTIRIQCTCGKIVELGCVY